MPGWRRWLAWRPSALAFREHTRNALTVINRSGQTIVSLEVALPWQTLWFEPVADGEAVTRAIRTSQG